MKIHEVLIESQLNEEMLTELDWSKIKKGLAAGIISLGALGISSGAAASDKDGSYEKQLTPAQAMQIIKQKLQQGEIKPAVVKQAAQKVDAAPEIKKAEPKVDVKPAVKKIDEPKVDVKKTEPAKNDPSAQSDALKQAEKNTEISKGLSQFSIKGLRFGMSFDEVVKISGATDRADKGKAPYYWFDALENFSIAGETDWSAMPTGAPAAGTKGELGTLFKTIKPDEFETILKRFTQQYGNPEISKTVVKNKMNYSDTNIVAYWKVKDAYILIEKYSGKFTEGAISIVSDKHAKAQDANNKERNSKSSKDF
jgi:hypothetical protein